MGLLTLRELLRRGVEVDLYLPVVGGVPPALEPCTRLRIIEYRSRWHRGRWYSRTRAGALLTSLAARSVANLALGARLLWAHRRRPYDAVYQLSTSELFVLGRAGRLAPPIVVHPCTHAAGELRWHRAEQRYALQVERPGVHMAMRSLLKLRSTVQPKELSRADLVLGLSERFNRLLSEDYGVPPAKLAVVRTAVDLGRFTPLAPTAPASPRTILFVSRISTRKGVEQVIELSHRLVDLAGKVRLRVIGAPTLWSDYTPHLKRLNRAVGEYSGGVPNEQLPPILGSASMLLVPSRYEPGSIVTAEALACGVPVVLSDEVGAGEVVTGPHVRFHRAGDVDGLEAAVRSLLASLDHQEEALRGSARANAETEFGPDVVAAQLLAQLTMASQGTAA